MQEARVHVQVGDARALPAESASRDAIVSGLVLNFVSDKPSALAEMRRVARTGATVAFYVWDYPGGGMEIMQTFWTAAVALDPAAGDLSEDRRFPMCTPDALTALAADAGLTRVACAPIEVPTVFRDFDDYWHPFTLGAGPAPGYCASLAPEARQRLRDRLQASLSCHADGSIHLRARAWAVRSTVE
jgi:SAM-dependent methyltransferase